MEKILVALLDSWVVEKCDWLPVHTGETTTWSRVQTRKIALLATRPCSSFFSAGLRSHVTLHFGKPVPQKIKGTTQQLGGITRPVSSACLIYRESYCDMHAHTLSQLLQSRLASVTLHEGVRTNLFGPFQLVFVHVWRTNAISTL